MSETKFFFKFISNYSNTRVAIWFAKFSSEMKNEIGDESSKHNTKVTEILLED